MTQRKDTDGRSQARKQARDMNRNRPAGGDAPRHTSPPAWRGPLLIAGGLLLALPVVLALLFQAAVLRLGPLPLAVAQDLSVTVLDRKGRLLRAFTTRHGRWRLPVEVEEVDPRFIKMLLAYEDKRFYDHYGIDPQAMLRAAWQLVHNGRIISGASTLTMQVARLLEPRDRRSLRAKLRQMVRAIQLERRFSKREILTLYLRLAPYGGNIEGIRAATLSYFGREPRRLTLAQAALLVALPQSPENRRPDRHPARAHRARNRVLERLAGYGVLTREQVATARSENVPHARRPFPKHAPHLAEAEKSRHPARRQHYLTLDRDLQLRLERLAREHVRRFGPRHSMALIVADHQSGEVLAYLGAADYLDKRRFGPIDMARAIRSPGSALKPFVYGLAFEAGLAHPETLIEDRPVRFGRYRPKNFDDTFHGTLSLRRALQMSLNIPAVKLLHGVGPARLVRRFERAGVRITLPAGSAPTLPVVLGGLGINLLDLATLYTGLARDGRPVPLVWNRGDEDSGAGSAQMRHALQRIFANTPRTAAAKARFRLTKRMGRHPSGPAVAHPGRGEASDGGSERMAHPQPPTIDKADREHGRTLLRRADHRGRRQSRMLSPVAAWYVRDILRGTPPPKQALPRRIAYKTGTSYGYRDAWSIGFDGRHVIAVWVGRPDGTASPAMTGYSAAAPILFDAFARLGRPYTPLPPRPDNALVANNAQLPPPLRNFVLPFEQAAAMATGPKLKIVYPPDGARIALGTTTGTNRFEPLALKARGGVLPLTWLINGRPIPSARRHQATFWTPDGEGFAKIAVIDANGQSASVRIRID